MRNNKGFTLIELLAVIAILGLLIGLAVPAVVAISNRMREDMYCTKVDILESSAQLWGQDQNKASLYEADSSSIESILEDIRNNGEATEEQLTTLTKYYDEIIAANAQNNISSVMLSELVTDGYVKADELDKGYVIDPLTGKSMSGGDSDGDGETEPDTQIAVYIENNRVYAKIPSSINICQER